MARSVIGQVLGGQPKTHNNVETVGELRKELGLERGYAATVQGEPADDDTELNDYDQVMFAPAVKGGSW